MNINGFALVLSRVKFFNRWIVLFIDLFLSILATATSLSFLWYILGTELVDDSLFHIASFIKIACIPETRKKAPGSEKFLEPGAK